MTEHGDMPGAGAGPGSAFWLLTILIIAGVCYVTGVRRLRVRGDRWPRIRSLAAAGGLLCLAVAVLAAGLVTTFPAHVVQHLLTAMLGPLLLALSAPITLALRTLPRTGRRYLLATVHSRGVKVLTRAPVVLILDVGGLYAYYLTPMYDIAHHRPWLQGLIHLHMFLAGCLLSWYLIGPDPMTRRPSTRTALIVLLIAATGHDILAKLMYAHQLPTAGGAPEQILIGSQIMYYGGNLIELLLATILMVTWYTRRGRALRREQRRTATGWPSSGERSLGLSRQISASTWTTPSPGMSGPARRAGSDPDRT
jgi:putative membrane protein